MNSEIEGWNAKRHVRGAEPIRTGTSIHFSENVVGNIGDEHRLEFAILGDMVNVASRLKRLTREINTPIIVSGEFVARVRAKKSGAESLLRCLTCRFISGFQFLYSLHDFYFGAIQMLIDNAPEQLDGFVVGSSVPTVPGSVHGIDRTAVASARR